MLRGYYLAANGMIYQERTISHITNNISNAQTAGYKKDQTIPDTFDQRLILVQRGNPDSNNHSGTIEYRNELMQHTDLSQGSYDFTERRLDMALTGNVYFNIATTNPLYQDEDGNQQTLLSRNGQFDLDEEGYLVLNGAGRVLAYEGEIQIGTADFAVDNDGVLTTTDGQEYQLQLSYIPADADIIKEGDNLFRSEAAVDLNEMPEDETYDVIQGAYERSNVSIAREMVDALEAQRIFQACSKALQAVDTLNSKVVSELGRMQ